MKKKQEKRRRNPGLNELRWETKIMALRAYKKKFGDCDVMTGYDFALAKWCYETRNKLIAGVRSLTNERIKQLDDLGFNWNHQADINWEKHYKWLKKIKKQRGTTSLTISHDKSSPTYELEYWIDEQRKQRRRNKLSDEKIARLKRLKFDFNPGGKRKVTDQELIEDLKRLYKLAKKPPGYRTIDEYGNYPRSRYAQHFGGLKQALKIAGIAAKRPRVKLYTNDDLLKDLKRVTARLRRIPSQKDYQKHGKYTTAILKKSFGSYAKALYKTSL